MSVYRSQRAALVLATARHNPSVAAEVSARLPRQLQLEFASELSRPAARPAAKAARPGIKKCQGASNGLSAQLNVFARSLTRTG